PQFLQLLDAVTNAWQTKRDDLTKNVEALTKALQRTAELKPADELPGYGPINAALKQLAESYDREWAGFGQAPKFPATTQLDLIMRAHVHKPSDANRVVVTNTLDAMASGGMY